MSFFVEKFNRSYMIAKLLYISLHSNPQILQTRDIYEKKNSSPFITCYF